MFNRVITSSHFPRQIMSSESSQKAEQVAGVTTIRRINREIQEIQSNPSLYWTIQSIDDNILEWHFTIRGPPGTEFANGLYHGRLLLPFNYPFAPPSIMLLNPNGRFETNRKICLSISNYHPELWQPAWGIRTIMEGLRSMFPTPSDGAIGGLDWPIDVRKKLAVESQDWTCKVCDCKNLEILPHAEEDDTPLPPAPFQLTNDKDAKEPGAPGDIPRVEPEVAVSSPRDSASSGSGMGVVIDNPQVHQPVMGDDAREAQQQVTPAPQSTEKLIINSLIVFILGVIMALIIDIVIHPGPR